LTNGAFHLAPPAEPEETASTTSVLIGVDTHRDFHEAVVISSHGSTLGEMHLPACTSGYEALLDWAMELGAGLSCSILFGIEGTDSYGAGLSRHLKAPQCSVLEVNRPNRQTRRQRGKDDSIDAEVEMLRVLEGIRDSAMRCCTRAITQLKALLIAAPAELREASRTTMTSI
jgi:transposase